jgi:hypothetical protein
MRVLLDDAPCDVTADSVMAAVAAAAALAEGHGRLIVEVIVDGQSWTGDDLDVESKDASSVSEVRLTSAQPLELVCQTLNDAADALIDADRLHKSSAELLQAGRTPLAMEQLGEAFSILSSVQQATTMSAQLTRVDLDSFAVGFGSQAPTTAAIVIEQLNEQLRAIRASLDTGDVAALADSLLYELPDVIRQWSHLLDDLRLHLKDRLSAEEL